MVEFPYTHGGCMCMCLKKIGVCTILDKVRLMLFMIHVDAMVLKVYGADVPVLSWHNVITTPLFTVATLGQYIIDSTTLDSEFS